MVVAPCPCEYKCEGVVLDAVYEQPISFDVQLTVPFPLPGECVVVQLSQQFCIVTDNGFDGLFEFSRIGMFGVEFLPVAFEAGCTSDGVNHPR